MLIIYKHYWFWMDEEGSLQCKDFFRRHSLHQEYMVSSHKHLPFHRHEVWDGNCFVKLSLFEQGFILHVGHGGEMCPG
jgi:hypothetical protein